MVIKVPCKSEILQFTLSMWTQGRALLNLYSHKGTALGSKQSLLVTPVLLSLPGVKETMVLASPLEISGLCPATGFPLEI